MQELLRATKIRHLIIFTAMLAAVLLYLERVCLGMAEVYIRQDIGIDKKQMSLVLGAFFIAYALGQVPSGWLSQRYGPRLMMTIYMMGWSIFGVFIALAQDFYTLFAARFLLGLSQAGAYPTAALLVKRWVPDRSRGLASGIVAFGGRFGGAGANWLTGILIVAFVPMSTPTQFQASDILKINEFQDVVQGTKTIEEPYESIAKTVSWEFQKQQGTALALTPESTANALNNIMQDPLLFSTVDATNLKLPSDAQAIREIPVDQRSPAQTARYNRLLMEMVFPDAVKQLYIAGWRPTLLVYGFLGLFVGALFWFLARDFPRKHPWINQAELDYIERGQNPAGQQAGSNAIPIMPLLLSRNQWLFSLNQVFSNIGWVFLITLMPRFLDERFGVPVEERGLMTTVPLFFASFGLLIGGWATDKLSAKYGRRWGRAIPFGVAKIPCVLAMAACPFLPSAWAVVLALTVMAVCQDFGIPAVWAFAQDTAGKQVGAVIGWANMWGNFAAGLAPFAMFLFESRYGWDGVLYSGAVAFALCAVVGILSNADEPLFPEEDSPKTETA